MNIKCKSIFHLFFKSLMVFFGVLNFSAVQALYVENKTSSAGFLDNRYYIGTRLEIGDQELDLRQDDVDKIERVTTERQRILLGFVGPESIRLEISRWYQKNTSIERLTDFDNSRGYDGKLIIQEMIGPVMSYLSLGGGVFKYDDPIQLKDDSQKSLSGIQYSIGLGAHWLVIPWLELSAGLGYQWQQDEKDNGFDFRGESQTLDLGLHFVY